jgi:hypothetical protein
MEMPEVLIVPLVFLGFVGLWGGTAAWAVSDAQKRGHRSGLLFLLIWFCGPFASLIWYLVRPSKTLLERAPDDFDKEDDALDAAARLEQLGDWDASATLYASIASRWPENRPYVEQCIKAIREKQARG